MSEKPKRDDMLILFSMAFTIMIAIPEYYFWLSGEDAIVVTLFAFLALMFWSVGAVSFLSYALKYREWKKHE